MANVEKDPTLIHAPGIYLGMGEEEYHADMALGSTDLKLLAKRPWVWQRGRMRPSTRKVTEDMKWGTALHVRVLEGKEVFETRYETKPVPEDFGKVGTEVLVTVDHLKDFLKTRSATTSKMRKGELIDAVKTYLDHPIIFDDEMEKWLATPRVNPDFAIDPDKMLEIEDSVFFLESDEILSAIMTAGSLTGGAAEVSVFYEDRGVRRKFRLDYAIPPIGSLTCATIADLKSFAQFRGPNSEEAALHTLVMMDYDIQCIDYLNGFERGRLLQHEGKVFGNVDGKWVTNKEAPIEPFEGYTEKLFQAEEIQWLWIMVHKDGGFQPVTLVFRRDYPEYASDQHFGEIEQLCSDGIENYLEYMQKYGPDVLWPAPSRVPLLVTGAVLPTYRNR